MVILRSNIHVLHSLIERKHEQIFLSETIDILYVASPSRPLFVFSFEGYTAYWQIFNFDNQTVYDLSPSLGGRFLM